jgi:hypothetical protein
MTRKSGRAAMLDAPQVHRSVSGRAETVGQFSAIEQESLSRIAIADAAWRSGGMAFAVYQRRLATIDAWTVQALRAAADLVAVPTIPKP